MNIKNLSLRTHTILLTMLLGFITFSFDIIIMYNDYQEEYNRGIKEKLLTTTIMAREILGKNYHDKITNATSITQSEYEKIVSRFNNICQKLNIDNIWSLILTDNQIVFTSNSKKNQNNPKNSYKNFFELEIDQKTYKDLFTKNKTAYNFFPKNGNEIHSIFLPFKDTHGRHYALCAAINAHESYMEFIKIISHKLLIDLLFFIPLIILFYLILRALIKPFNIIIDYINNITFNNYEKKKLVLTSGPKEATSLSKSINMMIETILDNFKTIQSQEKDIRTTLMSIGDGVIVINGKGKVSRINPEAERLTGWKAKNAVGKPLDTVFHIINKATGKRCLSPFNIVISTGKNYTLGRSTQLIAKNGAIYYISDSAAPVFDDNKQINNVVLCFKDITREYEQDEKLKLSHAKLLEIQSYAKIGYWEFSFIDGKGWISEEVSKIYGLDFYGETDTSAGEKFIKATVNFNNTDFSEKVLSGTESKHIHEIIDQKTGKNKFVEIYIKPVVNANGDTIKIFGITKDITEQHSLIEQLQHSQRLDAIGQLAGGIAHDFNNMLGGILGFTELINNDIKGNNRLEEYCRQIIKTSENAAELTQQLLSFARKGKIISTPINIHDIIKSAIKLLNRSIDKNITVELELEAENTSIVGDPSQLQSVILNLGINARDAMPEGGTLILTTETVRLNQSFCNDSPFDLDPGQYILIKAIDTGTGISKDVLNHIFEPFFTTKGVGKGTGLGLSAIFGTITSHHGAITVYSELQKGTEFHIYLPTRNKINNSYLEEEDITENLHGQATILIVDDEEIIRLMAQALLEELGYKTILAKNGNDAIKKYTANKDEIDIVLLDVIMPEMNGMECLKNLLKINPNLKIIIASGFSKSGKTNDFLANGAADFINKPYRQKELALSIKNILEK